MAATVEGLRSANARQSALVLSCEPSVAMRWLIPRLSGFQGAHPDIALHLSVGGGPVGVSTLAVAVGEEATTVEEVCEPFLVRAGMIARTPRGRVATRAAWTHLGLTPPQVTGLGQQGLFQFVHFYSHVRNAEHDGHTWFFITQVECCCLHRFLLFVYHFLLKPGQVFVNPRSPRSH